MSPDRYLLGDATEREAECGTHDCRGVRDERRYGLFSSRSTTRSRESLISTQMSKDAKISKYLLDQLFQVLREAQQQATVNSASHLYFRCDEHGKFIIQLNRVALPKMVDLVIKQF
ncbi:hypothetical protein PFISCL1PPCAC_18076, partial [Pristionchus fissidentatus]